MFSDGQVRVLQILSLVGFLIVCDLIIRVTYSGPLLINVTQNYKLEYSNSLQADSSIPHPLLSNVKESTQMKYQDLSSNDLESHFYLPSDDASFINRLVHSGLEAHLDQKDISGQDINLESKYNDSESNSEVAFIHRLVHLDLKQTPLQLSYLQKIIPIMGQLGATGLLVEYGEMFPYTGNLSLLARPGCYSKQDIQQIGILARANNLTLIPLVQSLGHLEFVLKHPSWKHLLADPDHADLLTPSAEDSLDLVYEMLNQVLEIHPADTSYIHIGGDVADELASYQPPIDKNLTKYDIYCQHMTNIAKYLRTKKPQLKILFWDSITKLIPLETLHLYNMGEILEPMISKPPSDVKSLASLASYATIFPNIWFASTLTWLSGDAQDIATIGASMQSLSHWLSHNITSRQVSEDVDIVFSSNGELGLTIHPIYKGTSIGRINVRGIALTMPQHQSLTNFIPVSLPSIAVSLAFISNGEWDEPIRFPEILQCDSSAIYSMTWKSQPYLGQKIKYKYLSMEHTFNTYNTTNLKFDTCAFPGSDLCNAANEIHSLEAAFTHASKVFNDTAQDDPIFQEIDVKLDRLAIIWEQNLPDILMHGRQKWMDMYIGGLHGRAASMRAFINRYFSVY